MSPLPPWSACRALTCSALPVRQACDLRCRFCFSRSSLSALRRPRARLPDAEIDRYYRDAIARGASRLVITGGGEPLLRPDETLRLIGLGRRRFSEIACFTNGSRLTPELARALSAAGLSYLCWSRHAADDAQNRALMGPGAPDADAVLGAAEGLIVRATCVMARGFVDSAERAWAYADAMAARGVRQLTFKHTYAAYPGSVFRGSGEDDWAASHAVEVGGAGPDPIADAFYAGRGRAIGRLPWGPEIRRIGALQICFYREPRPEWERANRLCRSLNLMASGEVFASLEDRSSLLYRLATCSAPPSRSASSGSARSSRSATAPASTPTAAPSPG